MNKAVALVLLAGGMRKRAVGPSGAGRHGADFAGHPSTNVVAERGDHDGFPT